MIGNRLRRDPDIRCRRIEAFPGPAAGPANRDQEVLCPDDDPDDDADSDADADPDADPDSDADDEPESTSPLTPFSGRRPWTTAPAMRRPSRTIWTLQTCGSTRRRIGRRARRLPVPVRGDYPRMISNAG